MNARQEKPEPLLAIDPHDIQTEEHSFTDLGFDFTFAVLDPLDIIQRRHVMGQLYERTELYQLAKIIEPGDFIVDIGANVGNHSIFFAKLGARVTAFEADPFTQEILRRNIALNDVDIRVVPVGLSDKHEYLGIYRRKGNLGATRLSSTKIPMRQMVMEYPAECRPLDDFDFPQLDLIKIDVEQMELQVLNGAHKTILIHKPKIFIEVYDALAQDVLDWAQENRYQVDDHIFGKTGAAYGNWLLTAMDPR